MNIQDPVDRFRIIAFGEGVSFLFLLGVAMPLKYMAGIPVFVQYTGWLHGLLFVLYYPALLAAYNKQKWTVSFLLWAAIASLLPFATFYVEKRVKHLSQQTH
jgi:integral membrane protein